MADRLDDSWQAIRTELRASVGDRTYGLWLAPLRCVGLDGDTLVLEGPPEVAAWAASRYAAALQAATAAVLGAGVGVELATIGSAARQAPTSRPSSPDRGRPNPAFAFDTFVIGPSNRLAHAAALAVAEQPTQGYNPLFICGPPGLGKTHLLHAIGNYVLAFGAGLAVRYATAEDFTNAFLAALRRRNVDEFKERYRGVDVLLLDDVQFLERKARSEEELFHTFNTLHDGGSQLVLTSDRLPGDLAGIEERLRERFAAGLVTDIERPDRDTRVAILRKRAAFDQIDVDDGAIAVIADAVTTNVRALEGALIRLVAVASLERRPADAALAASVLARHGLAAAAPAGLAAETILAAVAAHFSLTIDELLSRSRAARTAWARQVAMYLTRELTDASLPEIGRSFAGRDHTTVLHAYRRVAEQISADARAMADVAELTRRLCS